MKKADLTKREEFASRAMQGILSSHVVIVPDNRFKLAESCCQYADALIAELSKDPRELPEPPNISGGD